MPDETELTGPGALVSVYQLSTTVSATPLQQLKSIRLKNLYTQRSNKRVLLTRRPTIHPFCAWRRNPSFERPDSDAEVTVHTKFH